MEVLDLDEPAAATSCISPSSLGSVTPREKGSTGEVDGGAHDGEDGAGPWRVRATLGVADEDDGALLGSMTAAEARATARTASTAEDFR
jgi:hypothetical protein